MKMLLSAATVSIVAIAAQAQVVTEMTPERIREAIATEAEMKEVKTLEGCYLLETPKFLLGCYTTPYSRVVGAARSAKKIYRPFTETDATPDMLSPEVRISAFPKSGPVVAANVKAIVLMQANGQAVSDAIHPTRVDGPWRAFPLSVLSEKHEVRIVYGGLGCPDSKNKPTTECAIRFKLDGVK